MTTKPTQKRKSVVTPTRARKAKKSIVEVKIEEELRVGIRELRQDASRIIDLVKSGQSFLITEHGRPVAKLNPLQGPTLEDLIELGVITPATRKYDPAVDRPLPNPGKIDLVAALLADRAAARY
jgi:prevent-host-death family protein